MNNNRKWNFKKQIEQIYNYVFSEIKENIL